MPNIKRTYNYRGRTLAGDLALKLSIALTIIIVLSGSLYFLFSVTGAERNLSRQTSTRIDELADVLSVPVWNLDKTTIKQIARVYLNAENVAALRITDTLGKPIYQMDSDEKKLIVEKRPIKYYGQLIGEVTLSVSTRQIAILRSNISLLILAIVLVVVATIIIAMWFLLRKHLSKPLDTLVRGIESFARGDYSRRLQPLARNELSRISEQFNIMADQIQARDQLLEQRVADRTRDLDIASSVSRQITQVLEPKELLMRLVELTKEGFGLYCVSVMLYKAESRVLKLESTTDLAERDDDRIVKAIQLDVKPSLIAQAARDQRQIIINDVSASPDFLFDVTRPDTRSEAVFPMLIGSQLIGVLDLQSSNINHFGEAETKIFTTLAEQIAIAVHNAQLFEAQIETSKELRRADQVKSQFLSSMSHELRTPLNAIINFTDMVAMGLVGPISDEQKELLELSLQSSKHLLQLINDVLDISKIQSGGLSLFVEPDVNLYEELGTVAEMILPMLKDKPVELVRDIEEGLPLISGDKRRIRQILLNLLSNAAKFTKQGSITVKAWRDTDSVLFGVLDTGSGIPPESQSAIFEPFVQTPEGIKMEQGTGLGLPITRSLVEAHGGKLWLESEVGKGSAFYFNLPVEDKS